MESTLIGNQNIKRKNVLRQTSKSHKEPASINNIRGLITLRKETKWILTIKRNTAKIFV